MNRHEGILSAYCCSVSKSRPTLYDPMGWIMPGFPVPHYLPEFAQTHIHWVDDATQPAHPLLPPSPPALNLSQHQSLVQSQISASGSQSIGVSVSASALPMNIQGWKCILLSEKSQTEKSIYYMIPTKLHYG